jgi:hypothetical protein
MKHCDPILDELHKVKDAIAKAHDYDVHKLAACLRARQGKTAGKRCPHVPKRASRRRKAS